MSKTYSCLVLDFLAFQLPQGDLQVSEIFGSGCKINPLTFSLNHSGFYGNTPFFIADDHDVLKLSISSLRSPENAQVKNAAGDDADSKKIEEEFEQYQEKLKQQKADWEKEHPDQVRIIL